MTRVPEGATPRYTDRRWLIGDAPWQELPPSEGSRIRVLIDNDFSGDPDDLYQLVHHLLCPNVDIRAVIGSHLREGDAFDPSPHTASNARAVAADVFARMGLDSTELLVAGAEQGLEDTRTPAASPAVETILSEALREDTDQPLYYLAGGGLTDLASALLREPTIAERMTLVWIGGAEHEGLAYAPPEAMPIEYNMLIDLPAAQVVFNESQIPIWQVPRDAYRQLLVSDVELRRRVAATGALGRYIYDETRFVLDALAAHQGGPPLTYSLGDSPLVLLTALQSPFEADPSSSRYVRKPTPLLEADGSYTPRADARPMRVYTELDVRLVLEDFFLRLEEFSRWQDQER